MYIHDFERIMKTEKSVRRYLVHRCRRSGKLRCPQCGNDKLYRIEKGKRLRCARCRYTFHLLTGRWLNRVKINVHDWMWIVKLFELEASASVIAGETGVSYPTVLKTVDTIRMSIAGRNGPPPYGDNGAVFEGVPLFGIFYDSNKAMRLAPLPPDVVLYATRIERSWLILTGRNLAYSSLLVGDRTVGIVDHGRRFPRCRVYCDCDGFWPFAKERLAKHHGVSYDKLTLYLKESEFRWINRGARIFEALIEKLCCFIPGHDDRAVTSRIAV